MRRFARHIDRTHLRKTSGSYVATVVRYGYTVIAPINTRRMATTGYIHAGSMGWSGYNIIYQQKYAARVSGINIGLWAT
jgi:hypothetical protein